MLNVSSEHSFIIEIEYHEIINFLGDSTNQPSKFRTRIVLK